MAYDLSPTAGALVQHVIVDSEFVVAGDVYASDTYLADGDAYTGSWVIKVAAGSATIDLSDGLDESYPSPSVATTPNHIGQFDVVAGDELVVPASTPTMQQILDGIQFSLRVKVLSGQLDIRQIKIRIWPPDGAKGAWGSPKPGYTSTGSPTLDKHHLGNGPAKKSSSLQASWTAATEAARSQNAAYGSPPIGTTTSGYDSDGLLNQISSQEEYSDAYAAHGNVTLDAWSQFSNTNEDPSSTEYGCAIEALYVYRRRNPDLYPTTGVNGIDFFRNPDVVADDGGVGVYKQPLPEIGSLVPSASWVDPTITVSVTSGTTSSSNPDINEMLFPPGGGATSPASVLIKSVPANENYAIVSGTHYWSQIPDSIPSTTFTYPETQAVSSSAPVPWFFQGTLTLPEDDSLVIYAIPPGFYSDLPMPVSGYNTMNDDVHRYASVEIRARLANYTTSDTSETGPFVYTTYQLTHPGYLTWDPLASDAPAPPPDIESPWSPDDYPTDWPGYSDYPYDDYSDNWFPDYTDSGSDPIIPGGDMYVITPVPPSYTYLSFDLNTNTQLGEMQFQDVSYGYKLSAAGSGSFTIPMTPDMLKQQVKQSTTPGRTGVYVLRDHEVVWGGIIWKRLYDSKDRKCRFEAQTFESYFNHRFQNTVLGFENVDQMEIARTLALQAADEMHIDVDPATSGVMRYYNSFYYEFKTLGSELDGLSSLWDGFDWNVRVYLDENGILRRRLVWGYPHLGVPKDTTQIAFEYPGVIRSYTTTEDADKAGNRLWAVGGGQGLDQIQFEARDQNQLDNGWPLLETSTSYKDVFIPSQLQDRSKQDLERLRPPVTVLNVEVSPFSEPKLGSYAPGDWARFVIADHWNNPPLDTKMRITGYSVSRTVTSPLDTVTLELDAGGDQ